MMRDADIQKIANCVLQRQLSAGGFLGCEVRSEEDFDGESVIHVTAHVKESVADARARLDATMAIRAQLENEGDNRFVYLNLKSENADESDNGDDNADAADRTTRQ